MNKLFFNTKLATLFLGAFLVMTSCNDDSNEDQVTEQQQITKEDVMKNLEALEASEYVDRMVMDQSLNIQNNGRTASTLPDDCVESDFSTPGSYSLTFTDCDIAGNMIDGKITVSYTREENTVSSTVTFEEFVFNDLAVNGTKTTTFVYNGETNTCTYIVTSDLTIKKGEDETMVIVGTKTIEVVYNEEGYTKSTTGECNVTINEDSYVVVIDTPLVEVKGCDYVVSGIANITKNDITATLDYGDGTCDNLATMTLPDGTSEEIEL
ncbi:hypothetical protein [Aquimarina sp. RZ0]|uniref:hypothetical protein n=1 Tax=Aquimarina sp. RZ0 TaxID=2607730 RepID=UPI0011F26553|nr:hypothetical protein [Aquimarina sp. RZ0]KAA1243100.1 hypothetical protein F0000_22630 [Aquimarina sp. RZ0]